MVEIIIDALKCTGCGICVDACPTDVFEVQNGKSILKNTDECLICRACEAQCLENAIQVIE